MKKLLLLLNVFAFFTVFAVSSSNSVWSGRLLTPGGQASVGTTIYCEETQSTVRTAMNGVFQNLILQKNSLNTLHYTSNSGESLGSQQVNVGNSDFMSNQILQTEW